MIIETLVAFGVTVSSAYVWERMIRDRISVRRIDQLTDESVESLLDLYANLFPNETENYSLEELSEFISSEMPDRHVKADNIVLVAEYHGNVVGFLFCHYYPHRRKAIISYFAVDKSVPEARRTAAAKIVRHLFKIFSDGKHPCDFVFCDLMKPDPTSSSPEEREKRARPIRFRQIARRFGLKAYIIQIPYNCPRASESSHAIEHPSLLMCIPLSKRLPSHLSKETVMQMVSFIHLDCYGDIYPTTDPRFPIYRNYLEGKVAEYEALLPVEVPLA